MQATVVGGGILGCSAALALAQAGHRVRLVEQGALGGGSTGRAAGILSTMTWNDDDYRLIAATRGLVGETIGIVMAAGERSARGAWRKAESIAVASGAGLRVLDDMQRRMERHTEEAERMEARQAGREFPGVAFQPGEEVLVAQEDGALEAGDLLGAIRVRLADEGVAIEEGRSVRRIDAAGGRAVGVDGAPCDAVVLAGGSWTRGLAATAGVALPTQNYRTQLASIQIDGADGLPIVHDLAQHFYARPESGATILAGDGTELRPFEPDGFNAAGDEGFTSSIAERVVARFEAGGEARIRSAWAGLLVATPDRRPLCGPAHGVEGLFVLTGDNGFGLMRGMALGERLADAVGGNVHPLTDPRRFPRDHPQDFPMREGYGDLQA